MSKITPGTKTPLADDLPDLKFAVRALIITCRIDMIVAGEGQGRLTFWSYGPIPLAAVAKATINRFQMSISLNLALTHLFRLRAIFTGFACARQRGCRERASLDEFPA